MTTVLAALLAAAQGTLVVGTLADPVSLDPHQATDLVSAAIVVNVCDTLVAFRAGHSRPEPVLATTWATVDNRRWTFTLRDGVRFHDGARFDADAVVANLDALRRVRAFPGRAERVGPLVVSVTLERPNAALLATLSQPFFAMQSPRELARSARAPVGTGPFRMAAAGPGLVTLERHVGHWGGAPRLERIVFRRHPDEERLASALVRGEVDITTAVGPDAVTRLKDHEDIALVAQTGLNIAFLSLNHERPPLHDRRVRQAIARAIDRDALVRDVLGGHGQPARNPLPPLLWGYAPRTPELVLDRRAARRLLTQAGRGEGFEATLLASDTPRPYLPAPLRVAERLREDLAEVGIRARVERLPSWAEYIGRATRGDYDMALLGWQADTLDPNDFLSALLGSEAIGATNRSRYRSEAMDLLLKRGRMGAAPGERLGAYREAQMLFREDMPWVPLYHVSVFIAHRRAVQGLEAGPARLLRYEHAWKKP